MSASMTTDWPRLRETSAARPEACRIVRERALPPLCGRFVLRQPTVYGEPVPRPSSVADVVEVGGDQGQPRRNGSPSPLLGGGQGTAVRPTVALGCLNGYCLPGIAIALIRRAVKNFVWCPRISRIYGFMVSPHLRTLIGATLPARGGTESTTRRKPSSSWRGWGRWRRRRPISTASGWLIGEARPRALA